MDFRTDLAIERQEGLPQGQEGIVSEQYRRGNARITRIKVVSAEGERALKKPKGTYSTIEVPSFSKDANVVSEHRDAICEELRSLLPKDGAVLVCGIGNTEITPDALGPKVAAAILATRHISGEVARSVGLEGLRPVAALAPGVLGQTGIEVGEILRGVIDRVRPSAVIAVDALASRRLGRLGCTVQMADSGITPGSGVGNARVELSYKTLGIPVVSIGVPTVVDAGTLVRDLTESDPADVAKHASQMVVTPREIDLLIERAARLIAHAINCALQPQMAPEDILALMS